MLSDVSTELLPDSAVPGWPVAFRGSAAVAAGLVTPDRLRGPNYRRLFPNTYIPSLPPGRTPDLALRSHAAYRHVQGRGVLSGYSAAEILGARCGPRDAPAEVTASGNQRIHPGLLVHRDRLAPGETQLIGDIRVTTPLRTAFDLARWHELVEGVVAVDALAHLAGFSPDALLPLVERYPRARGNRRIAKVAAAADARAGSPMQSRLRMAILRAGLPRPQVRHPVTGVAGQVVWLDLAYPQHLVGVEYEEGDPVRPGRVLSDAGRYTRLVDQGWRIYRYTSWDVHHDQPRIVDELTRALNRIPH